MCQVRRAAQTHRICFLLLVIGTTVVQGACDHAVRMATTGLDVTDSGVGGVAQQTAARAQCSNAHSQSSGSVFRRSERLHFFSLAGSSIDDTGVGDSGWPYGSEGPEFVDLGAPEARFFDQKDVTFHIVDTGSGIDDTGVGGSGWPDGGEGADAMDLGAPDSAPNLAGYPPALAPIDPHRPVAPETLPGLRQALTSLFAHHNVVDLPNIR